MSCTPDAKSGPALVTDTVKITWSPTVGVPLPSVSPPGASATVLVTLRSAIGGVTEASSSWFVELSLGVLSGSKLPEAETCA